MQGLGVQGLVGFRGLGDLGFRGSGFRVEVRSGYCPEGPIPLN